MSLWYFKRMLIVDAAVCSSIFSTPSNTSVFAQSRVSETLGCFELDLSDRSNDASDLVGQVLGDVGDLGENDLLLTLHVGVIDVEVEAATLQRLGEPRVLFDVRKTSGTCFASIVPSSGIET